MRKVRNMGPNPIEGITNLFIISSTLIQQGDQMSLIVRSKVKACIKGMRFSGDFCNALDKKVEQVIKDAAKRAKDNGRATIRPVDI